MQLRMIFIVSLIALFGSNAYAQQRLALVIGNADYSNISQLQNPINDAEDIADKLESLNFDVTIKKNQTHKQMKASVRKFSQKISSGDIALFYYAGHGVQSSDSENHLIPINADIQDESDLAYQAINANWVLDNLKQASPSLKIMVLDACRDNPFRSFRSWRGSDSRGLARMNSSSGTIIAYAAGAGEKANDGSSRNGLFTEELLKWLGKPGIEASQMFSKVSWKVSSNSQGKGQSPFLSIQAPPPFCFAGCNNASIPAIARFENDPIPSRKPSSVAIQSDSSLSFDDAVSLYNKGQYSSRNIDLKRPAVAENGAVVPVTVEGQVQHGYKFWLSTSNCNHIEAINVSGSKLSLYSTRIKMDNTASVYGFVEGNSKITATSEKVNVTTGSSRCNQNQEFNVKKWVKKLDSYKASSDTEKMGIKIRAKLRDGALTIKALARHPMETGFRKNKITGELIPEYFIEAVAIYLNGKPLSYSQWGSSVSKNPYISNKFEKIGNKGDELKMVFIDNEGDVGIKSSSVK